MGKRNIGGVDSRTDFRHLRTNGRPMTDDEIAAYLQAEETNPTERKIEDVPAEEMANNFERALKFTESDLEKAQDRIRNAQSSHQTDQIRRLEQEVQNLKNQKQPTVVISSPSRSDLEQRMYIYAMQLASDFPYIFKRPELIRDFVRREILDRRNESDIRLAIREYLLHQEEKRIQDQKNRLKTAKKPSVKKTSKKGSKKVSKKGSKKKSVKKPVKKTSKKPVKKHSKKSK